MSNEKLIYIASKYSDINSGAKLKNTHVSFDAAIELYEKSNHQLVPYPPLWTHFLDERMDYLGYPPRPNEYWYAFDNVIVPRCDSMIKLTKTGVSKGADAEEDLFKKLGKPVYYSIMDCCVHEAHS